MACAEPEATSRLCLVIDDESGFAQWATLEGERLSPAGHVALVPTPLNPVDTFTPDCWKGASDKHEVDGEAVAYLAPYWYVIGSHGCSRHKNKWSAEAFRIYRVARGATSSDASTARIALQLKKLLETRDFADRCLQAEDDKNGKPICKAGDLANGVNVEGLTAIGGALHVGLRGPSVNGDGLVISFNLAQLFDPTASASVPTLRKIHLGANLGIRDLATLPDGRLLVLSGPTREELLAYGLSVVGQDGAALPVSGWTPKQAKAETVVVVSVAAGRATLLIMYDGLPNGAPELVDVELPPVPVRP